MNDDQNLYPREEVVADARALIDWLETTTFLPAQRVEASRYVSGLDTDEAILAALEEFGPDSIRVRATPTALFLHVSRSFGKHALMQAFFPVGGLVNFQEARPAARYDSRLWFRFQSALEADAAEAAVA